jgi:hypothetical protein
LISSWSQAVCDGDSALEGLMTWMYPGHAVGPEPMHDLAANGMALLVNFTRL